MSKNNSGYAIPLTIGVAIVTIIGGSIAGRGWVRSEIGERIDNRLRAKTADAKGAVYDDTRVLARLSEIERTHAAAVVELAKLKKNFERIAVSGGVRPDNSELRTRLDNIENGEPEADRKNPIVAMSFAQPVSHADSDKSCMNLRRGAECTLSLKPRVPVGVLGGDLRIAWPDWDEWQTVTAVYAEGRRQETLRLESGAKSLMHTGGEYSIWVVALDDQNATQRRLKIGIRRDK